jgi:hypothetical protein
MRFELTNHPYGFFTIYSFTDNTHPRFSFQQLPQPLPK